MYLLVFSNGKNLIKISFLFLNFYFGKHGTIFLKCCFVDIETKLKKFEPMKNNLYIICIFSLNYLRFGKYKNYFYIGKNKNNDELRN